MARRKHDYRITISHKPDKPFGCHLGWCLWYGDTELGYGGVGKSILGIIDVARSCLAKRAERMKNTTSIRMLVIELFDLDDVLRKPAQPGLEEVQDMLRERGVEITMDPNNASGETSWLTIAIDGEVVHDDDCCFEMIEHERETP